MANQPTTPYTGELDIDAYARIRAAKSHTSTLQTVGYEQWPVTGKIGSREVGKSFIVGQHCNELVRRADVEALIEKLLGEKSD